MKLNELICPNSYCLDLSRVRVGRVKKRDERVGCSLGEVSLADNDQKRFPNKRRMEIAPAYYSKTQTKTVARGSQR